METKKKRLMTSIFEEKANDNADPSIQEIVFMLCGIQISESDEFSTDICNNCLDDVTLIRKFRSQCISSDNYFKIWTGLSEPTIESNAGRHQTISKLEVEILDFEEEELHVVVKNEPEFVLDLPEKKKSPPKNINKRSVMRKKSKLGRPSLVPRKTVIVNDQVLLPCTICAKLCRTAR
jgi:hypothetical protein